MPSAGGPCLTVKSLLPALTFTIKIDDDGTHTSAIWEHVRCVSHVRRGRWGLFQVYVQEAGMVFCFSFAENHTATTRLCLRTGGYLKRTLREPVPEAVPAGGCRLSGLFRAASWSPCFPR